MQPTLAVVYQTGFPVTSFHDFAASVNNKTFTVHIEERPPLGPLAGIVWTMLTGAAVFIGGAYFGGMFQELGREHYHILKKALAKLTEETMEMPRIEPVLVGTSKKVDNDDPISMAFSVWAQIPNGRTLKLLIPKRTDDVDYAAITNAFLDFVKRCHEEGEDVLTQAGFNPLRHTTPITVAYDAETGKMRWANPFGNK